MPRPVEHDRRHVVRVPPEARRRSRRTLSATGRREVDPPARGGPDRHLPHVHLGQARQRPGVADRDHRHRAVAAAGNDARALERVDGEVDRLAAAARRARPDGERPALLLPGADHDPCRRWASGRARRACRRRRPRAAPSTSPRPSQRPLASAARSVTVANVSHWHARAVCRPLASAIASATSLGGADGGWSSAGMGTLLRGWRWKLRFSRHIAGPRARGLPTTPSSSARRSSTTTGCRGSTSRARSCSSRMTTGA